jgi:hypothetical protein
LARCGVLQLNCFAIRETRMKYPILILAALAPLASTALAQTQVPANQRYCLEVRDATGPHPLLCRFETLEQCHASRTGGADQCLLNPVLAFQQRR